jgi:hypothetical protein
MPTKGEIARVRSVLYNRARLRRLDDLLSNIEVLMNLNPRNRLDPRDIKPCAGCGPLWFIPANGRVNTADAADQCDKLAALYLDIRRELAAVAFPEADKRNLRTALQEDASSWQERARVWRAPGRPDVDAAVAAISRHVEASLKAYARVDRYLKDI